MRGVDQEKNFGREQELAFRRVRWQTVCTGKQGLELETPVREVQFAWSIKGSESSQVLWHALPCPMLFAALGGFPGERPNSPTKRRPRHHSATCTS